MNTLIQLAERGEKAPGPDRQLDADIYTETVGLRMYESISNLGHNGDLCIRDYPGPPGPTYRRLPAYTASIDAALTLVPDNWRVREIGEYADTAAWYVTLHERDSKDGSTSFIEVKAKTAALAIYAAALRARAAAGKEKSDG